MPAYCLLSAEIPSPQRSAFRHRAAARGWRAVLDTIHRRRTQRDPAPTPATAQPRRWTWRGAEAR